MANRMDARLDRVAQEITELFATRLAPDESAEVLITLLAAHYAAVVCGGRVPRDHVRAMLMARLDSSADEWLADASRWERPH
jgi:hypothetical protein